jgi:hypothetical protein
MLEFDENGYLTPIEIIPTTLKVFEETFAINYRRAELFQNYLDFIFELKSWKAKKFVQWVDGSYTTQNPMPNDIDIVTFLPYDLKMMKDGFYINLKKNFKKKGLDCHFVCVYPKTNEKYVVFLDEELDWFQLFSTDRVGKKKGILQLNF